MNHVGFSGTRNGMTDRQKETVSHLLDMDILTQIAHHGDCVGADVDFHNIARFYQLKIKGHPPIKDALRAFCEFDWVADPKEYIARDRDIVDESDWMIFTPSGYEEVIRSGTWATIRYTKKRRKPGWVIWPNGRMSDVLSELS